MKNMIYCFMVFIPFLLNGQGMEGKITYTETQKLEIDIPEEHREQLKGVIPSSRTTIKELYFNNTESIYKNAENQEDDTHEMGSEGGGIHVKMKIERPDNQLYKNISENQIYDKRELFGRDFLVLDEVETFQWKLINEQKEILGYVCQKAVIDSEEKTVEAWFAPQIPVPNGPMNYGQLPGMILEITVGNKDNHIVATEFNFSPLDKDAIKAPDKGKKVTREEYDKIVEEKTKEMEEMGGGNRVIIHRRSN